MTRHLLYIFGRLAASLSLVAAPALAQTTNHADSIPQTHPTTQADTARSIPAAIDAGLSFLATQQNADGSFQPAGAKLQTSALALLAYLSAGNTPDSGRYGDTVRRVVEFLLRQTPGDRYFGRVDASRMRGQAIVTLALCEAYGVEPDEPTRIRLHATVKDAVAFILAAQNSKNGASGGWPPDPGGAASDPATSLWCLIALRAAQQIGLSVPQQNLDRGALYLQESSSAPTSAPTTPSPDSLLFTLYHHGSDPDFFNSPTWQSASHALLASQIANGAWPATADPQPGPPSTLETAMHLFLLAANDQLLPVWTK